MSTKCTALKKDGRPCQSHAKSNTNPPRCNIHLAAHTGLPNGRRCTATNKSGTRCRQWAIRHSDPPRCIRHTDQPPPPVKHNRRCTAINPDGTQCRQWILTDNQPAEANLCVFPAGPAHPNWISGFHSRPTPLEEMCKIIFSLSRKITKAAPSYNDPIPILRELLIMCRCLVAMLLGQTKNPAATPLWKFCRYTRRIFTGIRVIEIIVIEIHKQKQIQERQRIFMEPILALMAEMDAASSDQDTP